MNTTFDTSKKLHEITDNEQFNTKYDIITDNKIFINDLRSKNIPQFHITKNFKIFNNILNKINYIELKIGGFIINKIYFIDDLFDKYVYENINFPCIELPIYKIVCKKFILINEELTSFIYTFLSNDNNLINEQIKNYKPYKIIDVYQILLNVDILHCLQYHVICVSIYYNLKSTDDYYTFEYFNDINISNVCNSLSLRHDIISYISYDPCLYNKELTKSIFVLFNEDIDDFVVNNVKFLKINKKIFYYVYDKDNFLDPIHLKLDELKNKKIVNYYITKVRNYIRFMAGMSGIEYCF